MVLEPNREYIRKMNREYILKNYPLYKQCEECKNFYPRNDDYFDVRSTGDLLRRICKLCVSEKIRRRAHKQHIKKHGSDRMLNTNTREERIIYEKKDIELKKLFDMYATIYNPATGEYMIVKSNVDMTGKAMCRKCKDIFPLTSRYFHRDPNEKTGFKLKCKKCHMEYQHARNKKIREFELRIINGNITVDEKRRLINKNAKKVGYIGSLLDIKTPKDEIINIYDRMSEYIVNRIKAKHQYYKDRHDRRLTENVLFDTKNNKDFRFDFGHIT